MMVFRNVHGLMMIGALIALAGCGTTTHPGASAAAPRGVPVSVPMPVISMSVPPPAPRIVKPAPSEIGDAVAAIARNFSGKVGIAVRAIDAGWTAEEGGRQRLPQQSVSKLWVAMALLDLRDQGKVRLDDTIMVRPEDLTLFHQPIAALVKGEGFRTTVGDLLYRALTHSDNTANDRLLKLVGGPAAVRAFLERKQIGGIRFGPGERLLQSGTAGLTWQPGYAIGNAFLIARSRLSPSARNAALDRYVADPPDGAMPVGIVDALARLAKGEILSPDSTRIMIDTMGQSVTGRARLRAVLPPGWQIAHKTGTGQDYDGRNAGFNDVGLLTAPDGTRYAIAVMIGDTRRPEHDRQLLIQSVAATVIRYEQAHGGTSTN